MKISDRVLKQYLAHVYWVCGGPCGGKSTMTKALSAKWGMKLYCSDDHVFDYQAKANPQDHPATLRHFVDWEWYFLGRGNNRGQWLNSVFEESVEFIILDLLQMGTETPIVVDTMIDPGFLREIAEPNRMIYLFAEDEMIRTGYLTRDHVRGMEQLFPKLSEPQRAREETLETVVRASNRTLQQARSNNAPYYMRTPTTTQAEMLSRIEQHFGLA